MNNEAFANAGQPHGAYGPAAVPLVDPSDEDYTWDMHVPPAGLPAARATTDPVKRELVAMSNAISDLQRDVQYLSELVQRLLKQGKTQ